MRLNSIYSYLLLLFLFRVPQTVVGLFWECDGHRDSVDSSAFAQVLLEITKSISSTNFVDYACALACTLRPQEQQCLVDFGFEVISNTHSRLEKISLLYKILLWLWDVERTRKSADVCLILVTENLEYTPFLQEFRNRRDSLRISCNSVLEQSNVIHHTSRWLAGEYQSAREVAYLFFSPYNPPYANDAGFGKEGRVADSVRALRRSGSHEIKDSWTEGVGALTSESGHQESLEGESELSLQGTTRYSEFGEARRPGLNAHQSQEILNQNEKALKDYLNPYSRTHVAPISHHKLAHLSLSSSDDAEHSTQYLSPTSDYTHSEISANPYYGSYSERESDDIHSHETSYNNPPVYYDNTHTSEQLQLQEDLMNAVYAYNVKSAVSTLRKMYTKQSRTYRIPIILSQIMPDTSAMMKNGRTDLLNIALCFMLDCIQWCFGVQKGENVESFKYKMNANIARWILREGVRKGIPSPPTHVVQNATLNVMNQVLENYMELNFIYELLQSINISQPIQRLVPYVGAWLSSPNTTVQTRVHEFLYEHPEFTPFLPSSHNPHASISPSSSHGYLQQTGAGIRNDENFGDVASSYVNHPYRYDPIDQNLELKLLRLLSKSQKGELGARIPALYRDEYGEPLRLRGRKLKDLLLETGKVDMYGCDGPGDKLFRIKPALFGRQNFSSRSNDISRSIFGESSDAGYFPLSTESLRNDDMTNLPIQPHLEGQIDYNHQLISSFLGEEGIVDATTSYQYPPNIDVEHHLQSSILHHHHQYGRRSGSFSADEPYLYTHDAGHLE